MNLRRRQAEFIDAAMEGKNIFLTGKAGTGKSFTIGELRNWMEQSGKKVIAVAPTGIAATNVNGQTIHSLFSLSPYGILTFDTCNFINNAKREVLRHFDVLLIDEISMVRADILDAMHLTLKKNGLKGLDERQVIFVGDLKQLPVVVDDNARSVLLQTYDGVNLTYSNIWRRLDPMEIELDEIVRQSDPDFVNAINIVRDGGKADYFKQFVHTEPKGVVLAPHNATVSQYNAEGLLRQEGQLFTFDAILEGNAKAQDFNLEAQLNIKAGCKIMYLVNSQNNPLRNGTLGEFVAREHTIAGRDEHGVDIMRIDTVYFIKVGGVEYALERHKVSKKEYVYDKFQDKLVLQEIGSIEQYPVRLAYAISIHKSQGLSLDEVTVDLRKKCFMPGQLYVALSRVKTPQGLRIIV